MIQAPASAFALHTDAPGTLGVRGALSFDTAAAALQALRTALAGASVTRLDLAGVSKIDSAGLSCIITVLAEAAHRGRTLQTVHVPTGMLALARVSELDALLAG
jgi:phospholipid transport system transporter-binding protein